LIGFFFFFFFLCRGQAGYDDHQRLHDSLKALQVDPTDVLSHKGAALALVQRAMAVQQQAAAAQEHSSSRSRSSQNMKKKRRSQELAAQDFDAALGHLSQALALAPAHPEICMVYAEVLCMMEQADEAVAAIAKCAALYRPSVDGDTGHVRSRYFPSDHDSIKDDNIAASSAKTRALAKESPVSSAAGGAPALAAQGLSPAALAAAHLNFGRGYLSVNRPREALEELLRALKLVPTLAGAHQARGDAFAMLGQWQEAAMSFAEAMQLRPQDAALRRDFQRARQRAMGLRN
jgi:tetratricopeptide (TPR) repeat protein